MLGTEASVPCGVVIEPPLAVTQRQPGRQEGRKAAGDDYVCGKVNVYTLATHVEPMCCSEMQAHLPVTSEEGKK